MSSSREFKPIVPSNLKGKATFSISLNRVNRVKATTSGTPATSCNVIPGTGPSTAGEGATRGGEVAVITSPSMVTRGNVNTRAIVGAPHPLTRPTSIIPRAVQIPKTNLQTIAGPGNNISRKIVIERGNNKVLLFNGLPYKTSPIKSPKTVSINGDKKSSNVPFILPYRGPPSSAASSTAISRGISSAVLSRDVTQQSRDAVSRDFPPSRYERVGCSSGGNTILPPRRSPTINLPKQPVTNALEGGIYPRPKKPCNCTKSMCLKLYCDCFANGEFCNGCNCQNCHNNIQHEGERSRSIKSCLERNPYAFHPKIGKTFQEGSDRHHSKGCHCKRSGCLKNYCECYEAKIPCSSLCKCVGCKNYSQSHSTLQQLADMAVVRHQQQNNVKQRFNSQLQDMNNTVPDLAPLDNLNLGCLSMSLTAATCRCLLTAASHAVELNFSEETVEKAIIEEFGQCLNKIIEKGTRGGRVRGEGETAVLHDTDSESGLAVMGVDNSRSVEVISDNVSNNNSKIPGANCDYRR